MVKAVDVSGTTMDEGAYKNIEEGTYNDIPFASGGVGVDERAKMEMMEKKYNLKMSFALYSKPYLRDVAAVIKNKAGKVLFDKKCNGPWLFLKLPEGEYEVMVSYNERKETKNIKVGKKLETLIFDWKHE